MSTVNLIFILIFVPRIVRSLADDLAAGVSDIIASTLGGTPAELVGNFTLAAVIDDNSE